MKSMDESSPNPSQSFRGPLRNVLCKKIKEKIKEL